MAWAISIGSDRLIDTGGPQVQSYAPRPGDGTGTVTESALVYHPSRSTAMTMIANLNKTFIAARERQRTGRGGAQYAYITPSGTTNEFRSEILDGFVELTPEHMALHDTDSHAQFVVGWTRQGYWERSGTNPQTLSTGTTINQFKGSSRDNYLELSSIDGDLPAPIQITLTPSNTGAIPPKWMYTGVWRNFSAPPGFSHWIEPTAGTLLSSGSTETGTSVINSNFARWSWSGSTEKTLWSYDFSATDLRTTAARIFRLFGTMKPSAEVWIKIGLYRTWPTETLLAETQYTTVASLSGGSWMGAFDLGVAQLPPSTSAVGIDNSNYGTLRFKAFARYYGGGTLTLDWDAVSIMALDSYRSFYMSESATALGAGGLIDLDQIKERFSAQATASDAVEIVTPYGTPLVIYPGSTNRLYVLHQQGAVAGNALEWGIAVYYRPRFSTVPQ